MQTQYPGKKKYKYKDKYRQTCWDMLLTDQTSWTKVCGTWDELLYWDRRHLPRLSSPSSPTWSLAPGCAIIIIIIIIIIIVIAMINTIIIHNLHHLHHHHNCQGGIKNTYIKTDSAFRGLDPTNFMLHLMRPHHRCAIITTIFIIDHHNHVYQQ